jgi:hypothetical protein
LEGIRGLRNCGLPGYKESVRQTTVCWLTGCITAVNLGLINGVGCSVYINFSGHREVYVCFFISSGENFAEQLHTFGENFLFDTALKPASLFDPVKFFLTNSTPKLHFLPKMTL